MHQRDLDYFMSLSEADILASDGKIFTELDKITAGEIKSRYEEIKTYMTGKINRGSYYFTEGDQEFIDQLVDEANASQQEAYYIYPVWEVEDPKALIRSGFLPTSVDTSSKWFMDWFQGMDEASLDFWWSMYDDVIERIKSLKTESRWVYHPMDQWKRKAVIEANSFGLILFNQEELLYKSKRPINTMDIFRTPISFTYKGNDVVYNRLVISNEEWNVLPVTRYAAGMSGGLYYETTKEFCGTFYYQEPESTTLLVYKTSHQSFNKFTAMKELLEELEKRDPELFDIIRVTDGDMLEEPLSNYRSYLDEYVHEKSQAGVKDYSRGLLPVDLMLTPQEAYDYLPDKKGQIEPYGLPEIKYYCPRFFGLYAAEDEYDQPLCLLCKRLDIDVLILENMIGSFQVVTEILDTRDRKDSFKSLIYIK